MKKTIAMLTLAPLPLFAAVWHVNASGGSDSNSGAYADSAKASIQAAIDASAAGDAIMVHPGTYAERLEITKKIELRSISGAAKTTINGKKGYSVIRIMGDAFGSVVDGFEITGGTGEPNPSSYGKDYYGGGIRCRASATIRNCIIHGNGLGRPRSDSATFGGGIASCAGLVRVENCLIYGNFAWACGGLPVR